MGQERKMTRKTFVRNRIHGIHKFKDKEILFVVFGMMIFFLFFPFLLLGNKIHLVIPWWDTTEIIFPFFPFLFWGNGGQIRNTLMWYYRNGFSLFFPFSVFPSKSFFLFFFYFFCRGISYTSRVIQIPKFLKTSFFGGKREKGKK